MAALALSPRERLVGNVLEEILYEAVLTPLGGAWVALQRQKLLTDERRERARERLLCQIGDRSQRVARERSPDYRSVLDQPSLFRLEAI